MNLFSDNDNKFLDNLKEPEVVDDPKLVDHIDELRKNLKQHNLSTNTDPHVVINTNTEIKLLFSDIILNMRKQLQDINTLNDNLYVHCLNFKNLSEGVKPYIYTECKTSTDIFKQMYNTFENHTLEIETIKHEYEEIEKQIIKIRRLYESNILKIYEYI